MNIIDLHQRGRRWAQGFTRRWKASFTIDPMPVSIGREGYVAGYRAAMRDVRKRELAINQPPCAGCSTTDLCAILGCKA